jgi:hypothetical protein
VNALPSSSGKGGYATASGVLGLMAATSNAILPPAAACQSVWARKGRIHYSKCEGQCNGQCSAGRQQHLLGGAHSGLVAVRHDFLNSLPQIAPVTPDT